MASLLSSAAELLAAEAPARRKSVVVASSVPATARAPSIRLPLSFIVFGLACLAGSVALIIVQPAILATYHYNQHVVAATHLALLGWIASVVFGALYQLVPVALATKLFSERLAFVHLLCHVVGVLGMVWSFWHWNLKHVGHWGSAFAFGVGLLFINLVWTVVRSRQWTPVSAGIGSAVLWLLLTVLAGLVIAAGKCSYESLETLSADGALAITLRGLETVGSLLARFDQMSLMHSHAHLGALGGFVLLMVTISFKLLPMFLLSEVGSERRAWWIVWLINAGLLGLVITVSVRSSWKLLCTGIILAGLALYAIEVRAILKRRKRRVVDWPLKVFFLGLLVLVPLAALAGILSWPGLRLTMFTGQLENLYGFLAVYGLISMAILGMLFKVLPFLVWYGTYSIHVGRAQVPNLADMYSPGMVRVAGLVYLAAIVVVGVGILLSHPGVIQWGGAGMAAAVGMHLANYSLVLSHRLHPRLQPAAPQAPTSRRR